MRRLLVLLLVVAAACGDDDETPVAAGGGDEAKAYVADTTVLESPDHGPELCLGGVAESYPPQCGGVPIEGWDWADAEGEESSNGTTWGSFHVVGTYDGETFTLTEPPGPIQQPPAQEGFDFTTPCPEPEGGWPSGGGDEAAGELNAWAEQQDGFAGLWIDGAVVNVRVTGDVDGWEQRIRERYDGGLCLEVFEHAYADLLAAQEALHDELGDRLQTSGVDVASNRVDVQVTAVEPGEQEALDERFGEGVVHLTGALRPAD